MTTTIWLFLFLLTSFVFGIMMGVFSIYSQTNEVCNLLYWVAGVISYFSFYAFSFVVVASLLFYVLHATGSFIGITLFMAVILICNLWVHYISSIGVRLYSKYFLKPVQ